MATIHKIKRIHTTTESVKRKKRHKIYDTQVWKNIRDLKIHNNCLCEDCLNQEIENENGKKESIVTTAVEVHHINSPFQEKNEIELYRKAFDYNNLVSLCKFHHLKRHNLIKKIDNWKDL